MSRVGKVGGDEFGVWYLHIILNLFIQFSSLALSFVHFLLTLNSRNTMSHKILFYLFITEMFYCLK